MELPCNIQIENGTFIITATGGAIIAARVIIDGIRIIFGMVHDSSGKIWMVNRRTYPIIYTKEQQGRPIEIVRTRYLP